MTTTPQGTVTFLFTDIVGSTRLWEKFPEQMGAALARHDAIVRGAAESFRGNVFKTVGDAFCVAFHTPREGLEAALAAQRGLAAEAWGETGPLIVRMGLHTGAAEFRGGDYFGPTLNRTSRIESAAHGGQILLSQVTFELLEDEQVESVKYRSLGNHRLRNLDRPEHLFQAAGAGMEAKFPAPRSMEVLPNNLPVQSTSFIGREREIDEAGRKLEQNRLLTFMGTGGTGKTRLALELGARVINEFRDGVWLVELALVTDPDRVIEALAMAVGAREEPERSLRETVLHFLRAKNVLLILDNCEHLLASVATLAAQLLKTCPKLKILAASRHALGIAGETTFPVPSLAMFDVRLQSLAGPDLAAQLSQYEAVKLFIDRAASVRPDFEVTNKNAPALAEICSRLDGIPLAIELAAARVRVLDVDQIAARLGDRFRLLRSSALSGHLPHQQTLQTLIDWSFDLLSEPERILFRRLGVFVGGRTLEALEAVCIGGGIEEFDLLDLIQQLVDKSLVTVEREPGSETRYTMIETVWQYAREKLETSDEADELHERHLAFFLELAVKAGAHLEGPDQADWLDLCQREVFNFRAAFRRAIGTRNADAGFRIFTSIYRVIEIRGNLEEARGIAAELLVVADDSVPARTRADFLVSAGRIAWAADRYDESRAFYHEAVSLFQSINAQDGVGLCAMLMGFLDRGDGNLDDSESHFQVGLEIGRALRNRFVEAGCLTGLGSVALDRGDPLKARELKEKSLSIYEELGDHWIIGLILWGIIQVAIVQRDYERARTGLREWASITRKLGNKWIVPYILECHACLAVADGQAEKAARFFGAAELSREHYGTQFSAGESALHETSVEELKKILSDREREVAWESGRRTPAWDLVDGD